MTGNCNTQGRTNLILVEDKNNREYRWVTMQEKVQYAPIKLFKSLTRIFFIDELHKEGIKAIDYSVKESMFNRNPSEGMSTVLLDTDDIKKLDIKAYLSVSYLLRKSSYKFNKKTQTLIKKYNNNGTN